MIEMSLGRIAEVCGGAASDPGRTVRQVTTDSRHVEPGTLFVALRGDRHDGHDFVAAAVEAGAVAALVERHPGGDVPHVLVGDAHDALARLAHAVRLAVDPVALAVTGSVGKTTVKDLVAQGLGATHLVHASRASFNNEIGVPLTLLGLDSDTDVLVAEIGARHVGDIAPLAALVEPDVSIVTAVAPVHLGPFGDLASIARTKQELVEALGPAGVAVLNVADPRVAAMASVAPDVVRVSAEPGAVDADVGVRSVVLDGSAHACLDVHTPWGDVEVRAPLPGRHQVVNVLLALAACGHVDGSVDKAVGAIEAARISAWRGQVLEAGGVTIVDDTYNANPTSMRAALDTLVDLAAGRSTTAVLGVMAEMGAGAHDAHVSIGEHCRSLGVDRVVVIGTEAAGIIEGVENRRSSTRAVRADTIEDAVELLRREPPVGQVVLVKASRVAGLDRVVDALTGCADHGAETSTEDRQGTRR
ncbi:MAG: UDP-N-acetylmuramoyl-tripeptide--D-alanyl-D-alanine ligase [Nitriliruptoraceae bacterium]